MNKNRMIAKARCLYDRLVCMMISVQLRDRLILLQKDGIDFDCGIFSGVFPVRSDHGTRFVVTVFCVHGIPETFGVMSRTRSVEYPGIEWDRNRKQFIARHYVET